MAIKKQGWLIFLAVVLGFFWSYSFSTRIGLLFFVPLWLKILVLGGLTINFSIFGYILIQKFLKKVCNTRKWI